MSAPQAPFKPSMLLPGGIPPLEPGDRLIRDEFERRYAAMPNVKKAELIEGVVYMPSAVRYHQHGFPHTYLVGWLWVYHGATPGTGTADNTTARLDLDNEPQPDGMLFIKPECGGQVKISDDDDIEGAPEFVGEISSSCVSFDMHTKLNVYRRCGVKEYLVWRVLDQEIDWFILRGGTYERLTASEDGVLRSETFPGLWLDREAMLRGDSARVIKVLGPGTASSEHAAFVSRLATFGKNR